MNSIFIRKTKEENTTYDTLSMFITYKMELQISYSIHAQIQKKRCIVNKCRSMSRPYICM